MQHKSEVSHIQEIADVLAVTMTPVHSDIIPNLKNCGRRPYPPLLYM